MRRVAAMLVLMSFCTLAAVASSSAAGTPLPMVSSAAAAVKIDLNKASREDLLTVPGIGPKMAKNILDLRSKKGSFSRLEDLLEVRGIGEKNLKKIAEYLTVPQASPAGASSRTP